MDQLTAVWTKSGPLGLSKVLQGLGQKNRKDLLLMLAANIRGQSDVGRKNHLRANIRGKLVEGSNLVLIKGVTAARTAHRNLWKCRIIVIPCHN